MLIRHPVWGGRYLNENGDGGAGGSAGSASGGGGGYGGMGGHNGVGGMGGGLGGGGMSGGGGFNAAKDSQAANVSLGMSANSSYGSTVNIGEVADTGFAAPGTPAPGYSTAAADSQAANVSLGMESVSGYTSAPDLGSWGVSAAPSPPMTMKQVFSLARSALGILGGFMSGNPLGIAGSALSAGEMAMGFVGSPAPNPGFGTAAPGSHSGTNSIGGGFSFGGAGSSAGRSGGGGGSSGSPSALFAGTGFQTAPPVQISSSYTNNLGATPRPSPNSLTGASPTAPASGASWLLPVAAVAVAAIAS